MRIYFLLYTVLVCINCITSQENENEEVEDQSSGLFAVATLAFSAYLVLMGLKGLKDMTDEMMQRASRPRLKDFPDCGSREENIVEPELCLFDCEWVDSNVRLDLTGEVFLGYNQKIRVEIDPDRVPRDISCMDDCVINTQGTSFDPIQTLCEACGYDKVICFILANGKFDESNQTNLNTNEELFFTPTDVTQEIFSYCIAEQPNLLGGGGTASGRAFRQNPGLCSTAGCFTNTLACSELLGIPYFEPTGCCCCASAPVSPLPLPPRTTTTPKPIIPYLHFQFGVTEDPHAKQSKKKKRNIPQNKKRISKRKARVLERQLDEKKRPPNILLQYEKAKTPWLCSLKTRGFRGRHRCGVALLSGPPEQTILVSAAHCNDVCKDEATGALVEICCCRQTDDEGSCAQATSYCGTNPTIIPAQPEDLQIVCGEFSIEEVPEGFTPENEVVLDVSKIINHPNFQNLNPLGGSDIAVYHINNPQVLEAGMTRLKIYPVCLPKNNDAEYLANRPGRLTGWNDPEPTFRSSSGTLDDYVYENLIPKQFGFVPTDCKDPAYMGSNTFYPEGTLCAKDLSIKSCITFGNSGSPLVREFFDFQTAKTKFAYIGPLTLSKGCDKTTIRDVFQNRYQTKVPIFSFKAENPAVFTDVRCYLDFIADSYDLLPPEGWTRPASCTNGGFGDINDADQEICMTSRGTKCHFTEDWPACRLQQFEGYAYNVFLCTDEDGVVANCANNCKGVDPNSIVVGGAAVGVAAAVGGSALLGPALGALTFGLVGTGGFMMNGNCPPGQCRTRGSQTCCSLFFRRGRFVCPTSC